MVDADVPYSEIVEAELGKRDVGLQLHRLAMWSTNSVADAEDLVHDALERVLDPEDRPWVPCEHTFLEHMANVMRYVWDKQRRKASATREILDEGLAHDDNTRSREPRTDDELERLRTFAVLRPLGQRLRADMVIAGDSLAAMVFDVAATEGLDKPAELAPFLLPHMLKEIEAAIKRLKYRARQILDEWNASEEQRMKGLREESTMTKDEAAS